jgi:hypothetical protein
VVPVVIAVMSALMRKLSADAPSEISAAHWTNSAIANACLSTADVHPTATTDAADVHRTATADAADMHPTATTDAADVHPTATTDAANVHPPATTDMHPTATAAEPRGEGRGCNC